MTGIIKQSLIFTGFILLLGLFFVESANAQQLQSVSDSVSTSRPSASAPIVGDQAANATQVTVVNNGSIFLASDSATLIPSVGETLNTVLISSMSAVGVPNGTQRYVYFGGPCAGTGCAANTHHAGDTIVAPITATHTIKFTPSRQIPNGGFVTLTFPSTSANTASPSATGFSFNGMTSASGLPSNVVTNGITCTNDANTTVSGNIIICKANGAVSAGTVITFLVGCTTQSSGTCTVFKPQLINPVKSLSTGNADQWRISIQTSDAGSVPLDSGVAVVGTNESVQVQGTVQPYITFSIAGVTNGTTVCSTETTNPGAGKDSTATFVDLGNLSATQINISAQTLTVSSNGTSYAVTATSSGKFMSSANGFSFPDANGGNGLTANPTDWTHATTPAPAVMSAGTTAFGIHPCAVAGTFAPNVPADWSGPKYANMWNTGTNGFYANVSTYTTGATSNSQTTVEYAATANATVPSGTYSTVITYVATPTF